MRTRTQPLLSAAGSTQPRRNPLNPALPVSSRLSLWQVKLGQALVMLSVPAGVALLMGGCDSVVDPSGRTSVGLGQTERLGGPRVVWDIEAEPLPEIPLPNDAATRIDPTSPTGRRLNISVARAGTRYEQRTRESFNELDGFGTYAGGYVTFDAPLNLQDLAQRHGQNDDFRDDAVFLLNVDPDCERFGEEIALNIGRSRFPVTLFTRAERVADPQAPGGYFLDEGPSRVFPFDPYGEYNTLVFEERNETDSNGNGVLDPEEDLDRDGRLDVANFIDPQACAGFEVSTTEYDRCVADNMLQWYDRSTNTLMLRPIWPMEEQCTHAFVLTNRVTGETGRPVESPFPGVNPRDQSQALEPLQQLLSRYGLSTGEIAFAWSFTTGTQTHDYMALREGLYGSGVFSFLKDEFPVSQFRVRPLADYIAPGVEHPFTNGETVLPGACAGAAVAILVKNGNGEWDPNMCAVEADTSAVAGFFAGSFRTLNLLADTDGLATPRYPNDSDERWRVDYKNGEVSYGESEVTFFCSLPYERDTSCSPGNPEGTPFCRPFPVILYGHGYGGNKGEALFHVTRHSAMGFAACGVDSYGHGFNRALQDPAVGNRLELASLLFAPWNAQPLLRMISEGRDRDLNNDGLADPGADQWTADLFHTRDMVRQSALDYTQMVRMLRAMDGVNRDEEGNLLGDVDRDGRVDMGGPQNTIGGWGISLGGIIMGVLAGSEPGFDSVSPNAGGAGLTDVTVRLGQGGLPEGVLIPMLGPIMVGCVPIDGSQNPLTEGDGGSNCLPQGDDSSGPFPAGQLRLGFYANNMAQLQMVEFGSIDGVRPGDRVVYRNLDKNEEREGFVTERGWVRVGIPADALTAEDKRPVLGLTDDSTGAVRFENTPLLGDRLEVSVYDGSTGALRDTVSTFERDAEFQGAIYPAGAPLVALQEGLGFQRNTPDFRRFVALAQTAIGPADPGVWGAHYYLYPKDTPYDSVNPVRRTRVLVMPTLGDNNVPVATGVSQGRASGLLGSWQRDEARFGPEVGWRELFAVDPRYGRSIERELEARYVIEGDHRFQRYAENPVNPDVLYDIDNVSDGAMQFSCGDSDWSASIGENECPADVAGQEVFFDVPNPEPGNELRINRPRGDGTYDAFRVPMLRPAGQHGIYNAQPFREFDADAFMVNFTSRFLGSRGRLVDHPAACDCNASRIPQFTLDGFNEFPGIQRACTPDDLNVCSAACAEAWGIVTPDFAVCGSP